ncbi:type IV pilus modification PilV family protein [Oceanimonas marisflavi]|uniref:type IV pilus modification PilV family protein n=1 Tax=Oceanimonas marisflavi TaxID=2059724 RepID=UPI000D2FE18A|nr:prepilin-type cleavage/methylation-like protein [Oceanimonas marisflavi]
MLRRNTGLSLLEYVIGLAILAIVLVGVGLFFLSQPRQLDPVFQFRAVTLGEALAEQVLAVKYDDNNKPDKQQRCVNKDANKEKESGKEPNKGNHCKNEATARSAYLSQFEHVDDFRLWCGEDKAIAGDELAQQLGLSRTGLYVRYTVQTCIEHEKGTYLKQVIITISDQNGSDLSFTLHRYNIL